MEERADELVVDLIEAAVYAGAYRALAREMPEAARGLEKLRRKWSLRVEALAGEVSAGARRGGHSAASASLRQR